MDREPDDALPDSFREIEAAIGKDAAFGLCRAFGGARLWIPDASESQPKIEAAIGTAAAKRLQRRFSIGPLGIPKLVAYERALRDAEIRRRYGVGDSARELAREFGLSEVRIYGIVRGVVREERGR